MDGSESKQKNNKQEMATDRSDLIAIAKTKLEQDTQRILSIAKKPIVFFWLRRDLRLHDNRGLSQAIAKANALGCHLQLIFIFDRNILDKLVDDDDRRVTFLVDQLSSIRQQLQQRSADLLVAHGDPLEVFLALAKRFATLSGEKAKLHSIFTNHDYERYATVRDESIAKWASKSSIGFYSFKDQCIFEKDEVVKSDGKPFAVFSPYMRAWKSLLSRSDEALIECDCSSLYTPTLAVNGLSETKIEDLGFVRSDIAVPKKTVSDALIANYKQTRDFPDREGTSRLSVHLRFGTISIRRLVGYASDRSVKFLDELIWREFYMMILSQYPHVVDRPFQEKYVGLPWEKNERQFQLWADGKTGYPMVDAGMRELKATGYMHNRVRMVAASFLTKHLFIDWRWGEQHFARHLLDFELSSNNGSWQWVAGIGCDAAPYFRIFNPMLQAKKFDPSNSYIHKWVPELNAESYCKPIVDHEKARKHVLEVFGRFK